MTCNTMTIRFSSNCFSHFVCLVNISNDCYIKFSVCAFYVVFCLGFCSKYNHCLIDLNLFAVCLA